MKSKQTAVRNLTGGGRPAFIETPGFNRVISFKEIVSDLCEAYLHVNFTNFYLILGKQC